MNKIDVHSHVSSVSTVENVILIKTKAAVYGEIFSPCEPQPSLYDTLFICKFVLYGYISHKLHTWRDDDILVVISEQRILFHL